MFSAWVAVVMKFCEKKIKDEKDHTHTELAWKFQKVFYLIESVPLFFYMVAVHYWLGIACHIKASVSCKADIGSAKSTCSSSDIFIHKTWL